MKTIVWRKPKRPSPSHYIMMNLKLNPFAKFTNAFHHSQQNQGKDFICTNSFDFYKPTGRKIIISLKLFTRGIGI
jgi:hypothetical protein